MGGQKSIETKANKTIVVISNMQLTATGDCNLPIEIALHIII